MGRSSFNQANLSSGGKTANILAGDTNEFVERDSQVTLYMVSSASGIKATVLASSDVVIDDKEILPIGTSLAIPDHLTTTFMVRGGTRLFLTLRETASVGTTDVLIAMDVDPL